jgi:hypothetical protein
MKNLKYFKTNTLLVASAIISILFLAPSLLGVSFTRADEDEARASTGPGKAVVEVDKSKGIHLSEKAIQTLGLSTIPVTTGKLLVLPASCAVYSQNEVGVYRLRNGWFKLIEVQLLSKKTPEISFKTSEFSQGDRVVNRGAALLRVAELETSGGAGDDDGH